MSTVQHALEQALQSLQPSYLQLLNESHMHNVPPGSESHFNAVVVSARFDGQGKVRRHQAVYAALGPLMQRIHALALHTYTPQEWAELNQAPDSPNCMGGGKHRAE